MRTRYQTLLWMVLFSSLWGINELVTGELLFRNDVAFASVWLTAWGFFILAAARSLANIPGTSTFIAGLALVFRWFNAPPFVCHLLAIAFLGVSFDLAASLFLNKEKRARASRESLTGLLGAYAGYALFALVITYIVRYEFWVAGGAGKVLRHIFVEGSLAAVISAAVVPLGFRFGSFLQPFLRTASFWSPFGAAAGLAALWTLGRLIG